MTSSRHRTDQRFLGGVGASFVLSFRTPPFGAIGKNGRKSGRYDGNQFVYAAMDIADGLADNAVFLVPQGSCPFRYSGSRQGFEDFRDRRFQSTPATHDMKEYNRFAAATGINLELGVSVDTSIYRKAWRGVSPAVEIVTFDKEDRPDTVVPDLTAARIFESDPSARDQRGQGDQLPLF